MSNLLGDLILTWMRDNNACNGRMYQICKYVRKHGFIQRLQFSRFLFSKPILVYVAG